jgi:putative transposase
VASFLVPVPWLKRPFWQARSYDFNVYSARKVTEKLKYVHRNPVVEVQAWNWATCHIYKLVISEG